MRLKLKIEPIPASAWGLSLASRLPPKEWADLRQKVYRDADYECEICGRNGTLHCHEVWHHDMQRGIQRLVRLECCCEMCHDVHHFGRSKEVRPKEYIERLISHWCKVNKKTRRDFANYEQEIYAINRKRANIQWQVKVGRRVLY